MKNDLAEQLKNMDQTALKAALFQALSQNQDLRKQLAESQQQVDSTEKKLTESQQQVASVEKKLEEAQLEIELLKERYRLQSRLPFVPSTEQMELLFDEAELLSQPLSEEEEEFIEVPAHLRSKNRKQKLTTLPADTPVVDVYHDLAELPACDRCGATEQRSDDRIVYNVAVQQKQYTIERHHYPVTGCGNCEADEGEGNSTTHWEHKKTDTLIASASMVADCAVRKYADGLPLYRQESIFRREGFNVSRQTISNWLMSYIALLEPLRNRFQKYLFKSALINQDETPLRVIHLPEPVSSKSTFMFVQVGTSIIGESEHRIVLYTYIRNRKTETLHAFTEGYGGYVMTDGLKGYLGIENHLNCWVHAQRGFRNIVKVDRKATGALKFISIINRLYDIEKKCRRKYSDRDEFLVKRKKRCSEVFDELRSTMDEERPRYASRNPMGKAIDYLYTYWDTLIAYVDCYESSAHNNVAEGAIKPYVLGRKGWLFNNTEGGAESSAFYYSLIETAKLNRINVADYLWYCLSEAPRCRTDEDWDALLPWNMDTGKVQQLKISAASAISDPNRTKPYVLRGAH